MLGWQADRFIAIRERLDEADRQARWITAGHERDARRRAHGARGIVAREADARAREAIDARRSIVGPSVRAQVTVAQIVGEDEDDVRPPRRDLAIERQRGEHARGERSADELAPREGLRGVDHSDYVTRARRETARRMPRLTEV